MGSSQSIRLAGIAGMGTMAIAARKILHLLITLAGTIILVPGNT